VLRGLNPAHCEAGLPTEGCFILKANDDPDDGPSYAIQEAPREQAAIFPLGARFGISADVFLTVLPNPDYGIARLSVGRALQEVRANGVTFAQKDDENWGQHRTAHAMITGHQGLGRKTRGDLQRHLAKLAAEAVLKAPAERTE
jgi:hypothetical protein